MRKLIITSLFFIISLTACGPTSSGYTTAEFEEKLEKLYGQSPEEVVKVFGKPKIVHKGDTVTCFVYEGTKDIVIQKLSRVTSVCFNNEKLIAQKPSYTF